MKLAVLGGGGFRVPLVYRAVAADDLVDEFCLYDPSPERLQVIESVLGQMRIREKPLVVSSTTSLDEALAGSDFIFSAIRVGGLEGRIADERAALDLGLLGQETTGPGGIAYALRTIPVAMAIAERVTQLAPRAFVINFTNPAGMITEAMQRLLGKRVIGICDTPSGLGRRLAAISEVPERDVRLDYVGLNHLGWLRSARYGDRELITEVLADPDRLSRLEEAQLFGTDWLHSLGMIPNEYLYYYYNTREAVATIRAGAQTRGEFLHDQQHRFYERAAAHPRAALTDWFATKDEREATYMREARLDVGEERIGPEGGGYEQVALDVMRAIALDERRTMILNVRNGPTLPSLPPDAVIEVPARVDATGATPLAVTSPPLTELGLMQQVKGVEQLTIASALDDSPELAAKALALHPLVDSTDIAKELLRRYRRNTPQLFQGVRATA
ncbi:MAG TPA: 6-phospho-beta-glucosidase [Gryllotalpicola sp.]